MSSKTIQYGPFTPQELESIVGEMQLKNIPFEISKDEEEEKRFKRIDAQNLVNQVHFRNEQYMAQIFYITFAKSDIAKLSKSFTKLGFPIEASEDPEELKEEVKEDVFLKAKTAQKKFNRRWIARLLLIGLICQLILAFVFYGLNFEF